MKKLHHNWEKPAGYDEERIRSDARDNPDARVDIDPRDLDVNDVEIGEEMAAARRGKRAYREYLGY